MARISIEDCLEKLQNRFALVHLASERARQLARGSNRLIITKNKDIVTSLREIASGRIKTKKELDETVIESE
ncbi:MAG TPA: DNA-directed RNA polymerase subunit omega [Oligoflexia bacterium]|nr:DNA-directed RNA polymerase subunit omega [Oligoflexia bacterium]HMR25267.1 DNA-directed RNA polymerase subunit omega [Oligoflexia bacterium]